MYSGYTYSVMRGYHMYNMYCRDFAGPIYNRIAKKPSEKKSIPLTVQPMEGAVVRKATILLFHMKRFRVRIPGEVNSLCSLRYLQIHYYKHYNKSEFDAPEIHHADLKV